ncbi:MAG: OB-fold domain-containing protein [Patescibacteria group bacterium]
MISYLQGKIQYKSNNVKKDNFLIVNVNGVGYKVYVLDKLLMETKLEQEIEVFVYTQVAETALDLFGFKT